MNTMPDPFVPTHPPLQPQPATTPTAERPRRRASGKKKPASGRTRKPAAVAAPPVASAPVPKKARKPRVAKKVAPRITSGKLGINEIVSATVGLKAEEAKMLLAIVGKLNDFNKAGKLKVVGALGMLFG